MKKIVYIHRVQTKIVVQGNSFRKLEKLYNMTKKSLHQNKLYKPTYFYLYLMDVFGFYIKCLKEINGVLSVPNDDRKLFLKRYAKNILNTQQIDFLVTESKLI